jgi:4-amino-4-deoxy-L-arabinose transferase-like glycosyltransferase
VSYLLLGVSDTSAVLVSLVIGVLTIPVAAWVAGRAFGKGSAAAAAALMALCGPHVAFSRMALTDATFLLLFLVALGLGMQLLERPGVLRALPFGLAVGLAQLTKYNGFLAGLSVALVAVIGLFDREAERRRRSARAIAFGVPAAAIAAVCYWPWFQFVQARVAGGYASLIQHHRGYLSPPAQWPRNALLQWAEAITLAGRLAGWIGWGALGWGLASAGAVCAIREWKGIGRTSSRTSIQIRLLLPLGMLILGALPDALWWLTLVSLPWLWRQEGAGARVLAVAWVVQSLLVPVYHPYARLALPLVVLSQLAVAGWLARWVIGGWEDVAVPRFGRLPVWSGPAIALGLALGLRVGVGWPAPARGLLVTSDELRWLSRWVDELADSSNASHQQPNRQRIYLLGRPSLAFYLTLRRPVEVVRLASEADLPPVRNVLPWPTGAAQGRIPWLIVDAAIAPGAVSSVYNQALFRPDYLWVPGTLVNWLDQDPDLAFSLGRRQAFENPLRLEPPREVREFYGLPYQERIIIYPY